MTRDLWIAASKQAIKDAWSSTLAHFATTPAGRYCVDNKIDHRVTEERIPRLAFGQMIYYRVEIPDLDDEHTIWFKLRGYVISPHGEKPDLPIVGEDIRFLPNQTAGHYWRSLK